MITRLTLFIASAGLICMAVVAAPERVAVIVPHTELVTVSPVASNGKVYALIHVLTPIGDWPDHKPEGVTRSKPRLSFTFPEGMKKMTFGPSLWSSSGCTIRVRFTGGNEETARAILIQQWMDANKTPEHISEGRRRPSGNAQR